MPPKLRNKQDICYDCNIFNVVCFGEMFERPKKKPGAYHKKECVNQVRSQHPKPSKIQVLAFYSLYKTKRRCGVDMLWAFVEAIVQSSDDVFARAKKKRPELLEEWEETKKKH